ncbi:MerR family transcriptional regulator [Qipengyuania marisflavi]|uniref:MerR family transcriptional regulator n=1 Tax=Qipengyuania marisflavi TaxID=2486356 RepID=A0A5S3Q1S9_9SPHN|nr:MerR family transcriptional regulator [Qipengyuania marisflavi]TMM50327.1 MerR family transcriptional regulator [Qipengyuania marisflavi]
MTKFDDGKDAGALRTIGEVAQATGIKTHVLRYWEQQFPTLKPLKRSGGRRYYRPEDVAVVENIDRLVNREGYTLKGAKAALKGGGEARAIVEEAAPSAPVEGDMLARLKAIREDLHVALAA